MVKIKFKEALKTIFPHVGMRKAKSLMAIFIAFWLWQLVRLFFPDLEMHPLYMYIYGILEMRDSSDKTALMGGNRIKATFVGLLIGLPVMALSDLIKMNFTSEWSLLIIDIAIVLIGVLIIFNIVQKIDLKAFNGLAAAIFIILIVNHSDDQRYIYSVLRACQTIAGVGIAYLLNVKIFPYQGNENKLK